MLITIDGEPRLQASDDERYMRVINTPFLILLDTKRQTYYLDSGETWFTAGEAKGPWEQVDEVPGEVLNLRPPQPPEESGEESPEGPVGEAAAEEHPNNRIPQIIVATTPTELIVTDGKPEWSPISDTDLLYISNSESDVVMEIPTQRKFVILSGRWYAAPHLTGPWSYVPSDRLPAGFAKIPAESEMGHLLVFVAGTGLAEEAVLDSQIPQTSAIRRSATLTVTYDGKPEFEKIDRKQGDSWQKRDKGSWSSTPSRGSSSGSRQPSQPSARSSYGSRGGSSLDRAYSNRQRGTQRTQSYQLSRGSSRRGGRRR